MRSFFFLSIYGPAIFPKVPILPSPCSPIFSFVIKLLTLGKYVRINPQFPAHQRHPLKSSSPSFLICGSPFLNSIEVFICRCSSKQLFLKSSKTLQQNICFGIFFNKIFLNRTRPVAASDNNLFLECIFIEMSLSEMSKLFFLLKGIFEQT